MRVKDQQQPGRILRKLTLFALAVILQDGFHLDWCDELQKNGTLMSDTSLSVSK